MKALFNLALAALLPFTLLSCGEKKEESNTDTPDAPADSHESVSADYLALGRELGTNMGTIKDKASAEAFAKFAVSLQPKLEAIIARAEALPAPSAEQMAAIKEESQKVEAEMNAKGAEMQKALMASQPSPEDMAAIGKVMQDVMNGETGKKMQALTDKLDALYGIK